MRSLGFGLVFMVCLGLGGLNPSPALASDTLVQVSTIDALLAGLYDGVSTMATLKSQGDFGIGTFDGLDGEMIVVDGVVYRVRADGRATVVADQETSPFASVTFFDAEQTQALAPGTDFDAFRARAGMMQPSPNWFYAFRLEGRFKRVTTRSVPRQYPPYQPLVEVVKSQPVFNFEQVDGVLVGFYCPSFVQGINVPGYHLHFLTADRTAGGHVLDFTTDRVTLKLDTLQRFELNLPRSEAFAAVDLGRDRKQELKKVEE